MIQKFVLSLLRKYRVERGKELGLSGWVDNQLKSAEKIELYQMLEDLDPEQRSATIRRIVKK